jgi:hypothetical protein
VIGDTDMAKKDERDRHDAGRAPPRHPAQALVAPALAAITLQWVMTRLPSASTMGW